jgi:hypothetical protein
MGLPPCGINVILFDAFLGSDSATASRFVVMQAPRVASSPAIDDSQLASCERKGNSDDVVSRLHGVAESHHIASHRKISNHRWYLASRICKRLSSLRASKLTYTACRRHPICQHPRSSPKLGSTSSLPCSQSITLHGMRVRTQQRRRRCQNTINTSINTHSHPRKPWPRTPRADLSDRARDRHLPERQRSPVQVPQQRRD